MKDLEQLNNRQLPEGWKVFQSGDLMIAGSPKSISAIEGMMNRLFYYETRTGKKSRQNPQHAGA